MEFTKKRLYGKLNMKNVGVELYQNDEIFVALSGWKNYWISNYSRLLECDDKTGYTIVEPYKDSNPNYHSYYYRKLKDKNRINPKETLKQYYHRMTAKAFCYNDNPNEKTDVHHIRTFDPDKSCMENNRADNLLWISDRIHKMLDSIDFIILQKENENPKKYDNLTDALIGVNINEEIFLRELICKNEPIVFNEEERYVAYHFVLMPSNIYYFVKIFTKMFAGKREHYIIGKFEKSDKAEIKKYGVIRQYVS